MLLKYGHLMQLAGYILDLYCLQYYVCQSNAPPFCKNYTKLYFDVKHLEKGLNRKGELFSAFFQKSVPFSIFLANIKRCPEFVEYALTRYISR